MRKWLLFIVIFLGLAGLLAAACSGASSSNGAAKVDDDLSPDDDVSPDDDYTPPGDDDVSPGETLVWVQLTDDHLSEGGCNDKGHAAPWAAAVAYIHDVVQPEFVVNTGDLADNECPHGQHQNQWDDYRAGVINAGYAADNYYDLVGNHDANADPTLAYYLANSISGKADGLTMRAWTRQLGPFTYSFIGALTATSAMEEGVFTQEEYDWTATQLAAANDSTGVFVLAHHSDIGQNNCDSHPLASDAGLFGDNGLLDKYHVTSFVGGHIHIDCEKAEWNSYTITTYCEFFGEEDTPPDHSGRMRIFALTGPIWANRPKWIVNHGSQVLITYPQDKRLAVPRSPNGHIVSGPTTIAAMAFSSTTPSLEMTVDSGAPVAMTTADDRTFLASFDFDTAAQGSHTIKVQDLNNNDAVNGQDSITVVSQ